MEKTITAYEEAGKLNDMKMKLFDSDKRDAFFEAYSDALSHLSPYELVKQFASYLEDEADKLIEDVLKNDFPHECGSIEYGTEIEDDLCVEDVKTDNE